MEGQERVRIIKKDHPHYGEVGHLTGEMLTGAGSTWLPPMAKVSLENCKHGTDACFATAADMIRVSE